MATFKKLHQGDPFRTHGKDSIDSEFKEERLGEHRVYSVDSGEAIFQFCEVMDSKVTSGEVLAYGDSQADSYKVEAAATTSNTVRAAGVAVSTGSVGDGIWVQKVGPNLKQINTDGNVAADSGVVKGSSNAGVLAPAGGNVNRVGRALQADSGSVVPQGAVNLDFPLG